MKEIKNIILYKSIENGKEISKACVFYTDGTTLDGDAVTVLREVSKEKNITSKEELRKLVTSEICYTMTEEEFKARYNEFLPKEEVIEETVLEEVIDDDYYNDFTENDIDKEDDNDDDMYDYNANQYYYKKQREERNKRTAIKVVAASLAVLIGMGLIARCNRKSKEGKIKESNFTSITTTTVADQKESTTTTTESKPKTPVVYNNDLYDNYSFPDLLNVTKNAFQKASMINLAASLTGFNGTFAKNYLESGHDIKAALSFDEVVALQQAYNNYSVNDIRAYFNGHEVNAVNMSNDYKNASLQLMGAYVIEKSEHPVDMTILINDQEGKDFYKKYHTMFLKAKEATGEEQLKLVNEFYKAVKTDFPVTKKVRTEGISHSESHNSLKDYQLAVAPMIAAAEMIFQNLDKNYTLDKSEINFINDIGLCNHADDKFERIETIMLGAYEDNENPLFSQYRKAIIAVLEKDNNYVIDDAHRELSNLRRFQEIVNGDPLWKHTKNPGTTNNSGANNNGTNKNTTTRTYTKTNTTTKTVTKTRNGGPIPSDKKAEIDKKIEEENKKAKEEAEKKAKEEAERLQKELDKKKKELEEKIKKENEKKKKEAEEKAKQDKSVKNVTTDGSGANKDLPDPNEYGKDFDQRVKVKTR